MAANCDEMSWPPSLLHADRETVAIFKALEEWIGFPFLAGAIRKHDDLDVFIAGGAVRDAFRQKGSSPKDLDLFIGGGRSDDFLFTLGEVGVVSYGPFGSPRWSPVADKMYVDVIPITRFRNGLWECRDIKDALNQFDFTANAIALDLRNLAMHDPQNGSFDARAEVLRAVRFDYPDEPIAPGSGVTRLGVLWMRLLHYAGSLGLNIEPVTLKWLRRNNDLLDQRSDFERTFFAPDLRLLDTL